jgi:hypothetical protein
MTFKSSHKPIRNSHTTAPDEVQSDQKVSVHLMIIQKVCVYIHTYIYIHTYLAQSDRLATDRQGQGDTRLTPTSVIPNSNYVIMVNDWNCLKYLCVFVVLFSSGAQRLFDKSVLHLHLQCSSLYCVAVTVLCAENVRLSVSLQYPDFWNCLLFRFCRLNALKKKTFGVKIVPVLR